MASKVFALFVIISIAGLIVSEVAAAPMAQGQRCRPGKKYFDGCNTCTCNYNSNVACTLRFCDSYNSDEPVQTLPPPSDFWY